MIDLNSPRASLRPLLTSLIAAVALLLTTTSGAWAIKGDCGQPSSNGVSPVASDCLYILKVAVGTLSCDPCVCDTNDSSATTASDALLCLRDAVGQPVNLTCPGCATTTTTSSSSTTSTSTTTTSTTTTTTLAPPVCGNGITEGGETCDGDCPHCADVPPCFENLGSDATCDVTCKDPILDCRAVADSCCPYVPADSSCSSATDADCAGTQWKSMAWLQPISWPQGGCTTVRIYGLSKGDNYMFTTCHPGGAETVGDPVITTIVDNNGISYPVGNDDCNEPSAIPHLAGWDCTDGVGQIHDPCTGNNSGGFIAASNGSTMYRMDVTVCGYNSSAGNARFFIWYNGKATPNAG